LKKTKQSFISIENSEIGQVSGGRACDWDTGWIWTCPLFEHLHSPAYLLC